MARVLDSTSIVLLSSFVLTQLAACNQHPLKPVELQTGQECQAQVELSINKDVDILFVIDNSGSMGEEQANLAANFGAFIELLEAPTVEANYRIGVTRPTTATPGVRPARPRPRAASWS